jgi:hypothetical protein
MPRNSSAPQSRSRRIQPAQLAAPPRSKNQRRPRRTQGPRASTFTVPFGDVVVKTGKTTVTLSPSLLPSETHLRSILQEVKNYSLHRPHTARVIFRPANPDQSGQIAFAFDPVSNGTWTTPSQIRGYEQSAGGLVSNTQTLVLPGSAFSHVPWTPWSSTVARSPGFVTLCASVPSAPATDLILGTLDLVYTIQSKFRRPLPSAT